MHQEFNVDALEASSFYMTRRSNQASTAEHRTAKYVPPTSWQTVPSQEFGFANEMLLRAPTLYLAGDRSLLLLPCVAIVGSRRVSPEGAKLAGDIAKALARVGVVTMSGLAEGVDYAAHTAAIAAGGKTIAVIGTPLTKAYPSKHAQLQQDIYKHHLLVSQFRDGERTFPSHFPERNRVMARLSQATVIVEASDTSGSLHQAVECEKSGRQLFIAGAVLDNNSLTWPSRFTHVRFDSAEDVIAEVSLRF